MKTTAVRPRSLLPPLRAASRLVLVLLATSVVSGTAGSRIPTLAYRGSGYGKVVFDHRVHASEGFRCVDCHTNFAGTGRILFETRKRGLITFPDHAAGRKCFACHNGDGVPAANRGAFYDGRKSLDDCNHCHWRKQQ